MSENVLQWNFPDSKRIRHIDFKNKEEITELLVKFMLQRTNAMFKWKGLPSTIPQDYLEELLQTIGYAGIIKDGDKLFAVYGGVGGERNYNYRATRLIISNPYLLANSKTYKVYYGEDSEVKSPVNSGISYDGDCVIIRNDNFYMGLIPICEFYASQLTENLLTKRIGTINIRAIYAFIAGDSDIAEDFKDFYDALERGDSKAIVAEGLLGDGAQNSVNTLPLAEKGHQALTDLIEDQQYIRACWYNDLGLQANYNMKRESINSNESQLNKDAVLPLVDTMLNMRIEACKHINELFGTNISVELSSAWGYTRDTIEQAIDAIDDSTQMKKGSEGEIEVATQVANEQGEKVGDDNENS